MKSWTFSKKLVFIMLLIGVIDIHLCFILAFLDKIVPETLACALVTEVLGVCIAYFTKAYKETKAEEDIKLEREKLFQENNGEG